MRHRQAPTALTAVPVVDLFAGPGGLSEGLANVTDRLGRPFFDVRLSIEKEETAHSTLLLRSIYRAVSGRGIPDCYYDYLRGAVSRAELLAHPAVRSAAAHAAEEARCAELGRTPHVTVDAWIRKATAGSTDWVLIGGPPCQAYSLVGRSRLRPVDPKAFEDDARHFLYREYLRIIRRFSPAVFVMENVKGLLTSRHKGTSMFARILSDLRKPGADATYRVGSLVTTSDDPEPSDFVIESERFSLPQKRHRVILLGVRSDIASRIDWSCSSLTLSQSQAIVSASAALGDLPRLRSRLSREHDDHDSWIRAVREATKSLRYWRGDARAEIEARMASATREAAEVRSFGGRFVETAKVASERLPASLEEWIRDARLGGVSLHETRRHMRSDLHRYLFAASFADVFHCSPKLPLFPPELMPAHGNVESDDVPFLDRFRVQLRGEPSTTVVSHIAKDGHYYIHYDPAQCRSLTVREAARLQTFPDNYFFEGNRTEQYVQVGNAVPPFLARQIGEVVRNALFAAQTDRADRLATHNPVPDR